MKYLAGSLTEKSLIAGLNAIIPILPSLVPLIISMLNELA